MHKRSQVVDYYQAVVINAQDYYPFGMEMPGRNYSATSALYRFAFNGQEKDREWNKTHFRFREYDERSGRMISVDPLSSVYPWYSPYQFAGNTPIWAIDTEGLQPKPTTTGQEGQQQTTVYNPMEEGPRMRYQLESIDGTRKDWAYHEGGYGDAKADWYTKDYYKTIVAEIARREGKEALNAKKYNLFASSDGCNCSFFDAQSEAWVSEYGQLYVQAYSEGYTKAMNSGQGIMEPVYIEFDLLTLGQGVALKQASRAFLSKMFASKVDDVAAKGGRNIIHHIASNKHLSKYTPKFESIANKYGLKLDAAWNKVDISDVYHYSKHPNQYHDFVLDGMMRADMGATGNQAKFLQLFDQYVKQPLLQNPNMLNKTGW
ncbi:MAG: hypothetical protein HC892_23220 [Saprospiraceae bacterium]|nr:hypothetical protein [Saprospiraceae bacterium]